MKTTPVHCDSLKSFHRAARISAVALLTAGLGFGTASAQTTTQPSSSQSGRAPGDQNGPSAVIPSSAGAAVNTPATNASGESGSYSSTNSERSSLKHSDRHFLTTAAKSSEREVAIAQLAEQRAGNPQIRSYAQQLVTEHEQMNRDLVQLAQQKGVQLKDVAALNVGSSMATTAPSASASASGTAANASSSAYATTDDESVAASDRHYRTLEKKNGADFDEEFVAMMVAAHQKDVKLFRKEAADAKDPDVKAFASQHVAALQAHLDQASSLTRSAAE